MRIEIHTSTETRTGHVLPVSIDPCTWDDEIQFIDDETGRRMAAYGWMFAAELDGDTLILS